MKSENASASHPGKSSGERLRSPKIIGQVDNPVLEAARRLFWRALDRICGFFVGVRLSIDDRIFGPEPVTSGDEKRERDHERLIRAFPTVEKTTGDGHADLKDA
jgi:hypothetical protein